MELLDEAKRRIQATLVERRWVGGWVGGWGHVVFHAWRKFNAAGVGWSALSGLPLLSTARACSCRLPATTAPHYALIPHSPHLPPPLLPLPPPPPSSTPPQTAGLTPPPRRWRRQRPPWATAPSSTPTSRTTAPPTTASPTTTCSASRWAVWPFGMRFDHLKWRARGFWAGRASTAESGGGAPTLTN